MPDRNSYCFCWEGPIDSSSAPNLLRSYVLGTVLSSAGARVNVKSLSPLELTFERGNRTIKGAKCIFISEICMTQLKSAKQIY